MDRALDDIISERPRGPRKQDRRRDERPAPPRAPRRDDYPRDGIRKNRTEDRQDYRPPNRRDERTNIDTDWVHDRYDDEYTDRRRKDSPDYDDRRAAPRGERRPERRYAEPGTKLRVENLHYDLTKDDIEELFTRIGPVQFAELLYDRSDRSRGIAYVTYIDARDADEAIRQFDGANAHGQPIRVTAATSGPPARNGGSLFDRVEQPGRSLFDRVDQGGRRGGRGRSSSPRKERRDDDRYVPDRRGERSPRRGGPRERGRRPGARREESGREGRKPRGDEQGRPMAGGRPRKTAEELDAEMADYFGAAEKNTNGTAETGTAATGNGDADIDMIS